MFTLKQAANILGVNSARLRTWCTQNIVSATASHKIKTYTPPVFTKNDLFTIFVFSKLVDWGLRREVAQKLSAEIVHMATSSRVKRTTIELPAIKGLRIVIAKRKLKDEFENRTICYIRKK